MKKVMPIVYVTDMNRAIDFYTALGLELGERGRNPMWTELFADKMMMALHYIESLPYESNGQVGISMVTDISLEDLTDKLKQHDIDPYRGIADETFGRSMVVQDPDGLLIQINEYDPELYS